MISSPKKKEKKKEKKSDSFFCPLVNRALSWRESIVGGLNKHKLYLSKIAFFHRHSICEGASHSQFDPLIFLSPRKKNNFLLLFFFFLPAGA